MSASAPLSGGVVSISTACGRSRRAFRGLRRPETNPGQLDLLGAVQHPVISHGRPYRVERAVGLLPLPGFAEVLRQSAVEAHVGWSKAINLGGGVFLTRSPVAVPAAPRHPDSRAAKSNCA